MNIAIIIPARYGSTRFPGKPLALLNGTSMLAHVVEKARAAANKSDSISITVATDDDRIMEHASDLGVDTLMTPQSCKTGSDRVLAAAKQLAITPDFVVGLQGDVPLIPVNVIQRILETLQNGPHGDVITPVHRLNWEELDRFRAAKTESPFSGTTAIIDEQNCARWFSKNIIPAIRKENDLRTAQEHSPVWRHIGLYAYKLSVLETFAALPETTYEQLEGLEQLRMLENRISIQCVPVEMPAGALLSGIDSPEDLSRAEQLLRTAPQT